MAKVRIASPGFDEPEAKSVLSLVSDDDKDWYLDDEEAGWSYCFGIARLAKRLTERKLSIQFMQSTSKESPKYECCAKWRSGSISYALTSGPCSSTREAFERIISLVTDVPRNDELNWHKVLKEKVPYEGMSAPSFINTTSIGIPTIVCTLNWGTPADRREAKSNESPSRIEAFEDAIEKALKIGPAFNPLPKKNAAAPKSHAPINWEHAARVQTGKHLENSKVLVEFEGTEKGFICRIKHGIGETQTTQSSPQKSEKNAFDQAVQLLKSRLLKEGVTACGAPRKKDANRVKDVISEAASIRLLAEAKARWTIERAWLMELPHPTKRQNERLHDLNIFFVLLDPLRRLEIDRGSREVGIARITSELKRINSEGGAASISIRHAEQLRTLIGCRFKSAGALVVQTEKFNEHVRSIGINPIAAINNLVKSRLLRQTSNGSLALSILGANLLEKHLSTEMKPGSLGDSLPQGVLAMILDLKDSLGSSSSSLGD